MTFAEDLAAAHAQAALRFSLIASVIAERDATATEQSAYDHAAEAMRAALQALLDHVPATTYELNFKARYLLSRIALGDLYFDPEYAPALLQSIARFHPERAHA
ncbi:hypothetical protein [uncultured Devosia sp.]|uniref:hypothetical protein n=1 Tax=uncultured Devosia sp. TaxID=211434 RepID=UPI0035CA03F8